MFVWLKQCAILPMVIGIWGIDHSSIQRCSSLSLLCAGVYLDCATSYVMNYSYWKVTLYTYLVIWFVYANLSVSGKIINTVLYFWNYSFVYWLVSCMVLFTLQKLISIISFLLENIVEWYEKNWTMDLFKLFLLDVCTSNIMWYTSNIIYWVNVRDMYVWLLLWKNFSSV